MSLDISQQKIKEEKIIKSEKKYRLLVKNSHDIIYTLSKEGIFLSVSSAWTRLLGHPIKQVIGQSFQKFVHPDDIPAYKEFLQKVMVLGKRQSGVEYRIKNQKGDWCWHFSKGIAIKEKTGLVNSLEGIASDITKEKLLWKAFQKQRYILEAQQEMSLDGILMVDKAGKIVSYNKRFVEMWEIPNKVICKKSDKLAIKSVLSKLVDPEQFLYKVNWLYKFTKESSKDELILKDGRVFARFSNSINTVDGEYLGRLWFFNDITHHRLAEEKAIQTQKRISDVEKMESLGQIGAGVAHEINNPLTGIIGFSEAILHDLEKGEYSKNEIVKDLKIILKNADRCRNIVSNLSTFSLSKRSVKTELNINRLLEETVSCFSYNLKKLNIEVIKNFEESVFLVKVDEAQIVQVFSNIIINAQKAMKKGGKITLSTRLKNDFVNIEIKDTGVGIKKEDIHKVFNPFYTTNGLGLGLSISFNIIKQHNGYIGVKSAGENKGAVFWIKIPA